MWIVNDYAHSQFNIPHSWSRQSPVNFFMKELSNELGAFMMRIVNGKFARHIMNTHRRLPSTFMMWIVKRDVGVFSAIRIRNEKCKSRPIRKKHSKIQPIEDKDKNIFRMWNVIFRHFPHFRHISTFIMEMAISNGFGIKHWRILNTFGNLKEHIIIF